MREGAQARGRRHSRGKRGCLAERCRVPQEGATPLHAAAGGGHTAVVELLLAAGADKEAQDEVRGGGVVECGYEGKRGHRQLFV